MGGVWGEIFVLCIYNLGLVLDFFFLFFGLGFGFGFGGGGEVLF